MPLFAVIGFDDTPRSAELREANRAEHRAYSKENDGLTRLAGAFYGEDGNQCGTLKIFEADSAEEVWEWYRKEPFYKAGVYRAFHIVEWKLALNRIEKREWDPNFPTKK